MLKRRIGLCLFLLIFLVTALTSTVLAQSNQSQGAKGAFTDIKQNHWAYKAIKEMVSKKYLSGYSDGTFRPKKNISRGEFAQLMVTSIGIPKVKSNHQYFLDVAQDHWAFTAVETSRPYLTGFRTSAGDMFFPSKAAVREDMAVALVKALGRANDNSDLSILKQFKDEADISSNLRKYVALAVELGIMRGTQDKEGGLRFNAQNPLTRAEAATLIYNIVKDSSSIKVTYDENTEPEKPQIENPVKTVSDYTAPKVSGRTMDEGIFLTWNQINDTRFQGYKVVISKHDSSPEYPENGYLFYITDRTRTSAMIDNSSAYTGGDFGSYLTPGSTYYFGVTALYPDRKVAGNTIKLTYPGEAAAEETLPAEYTAPTVRGSADDTVITLNWNPVNDTRLQGYKVVISKNDTSPRYPDDGYLYWITDKNRSSAVIDNSSAYNGGDFGEYLTPGEQYYFSITAVYNDTRVAGNAIVLTYPAAPTPAEYSAPSVTGAPVDGRIIINWAPITDDRLQGYKVVISKNNPGPKYPDDGYLYWITDKNQSSAVIDNSSAYNGGDFGEYLIPGENYYFSVTAVYNDVKIPGNVITMAYPG